jgi:hypothetical protein
VGSACFKREPPRREEIVKHVVVAILFFVIWTALYVALVIYILFDVLMQTRKYAKNSESKELAEISSKVSVQKPLRPSGRARHGRMGRCLPSDRTNGPDGI